MICPTCKDKMVETEMEEETDYSKRGKVVEIILTCPTCSETWFGTLYKSDVPDEVA